MNLLAIELETFLSLQTSSVCASHSNETNRITRASSAENLAQAKFRGVQIDRFYSAFPAWRKDR